MFEQLSELFGLNQKALKHKPKEQAKEETDVQTNQTITEKTTPPPALLVDPDIIKAEKHLEALGFFSPSTKRNKRKGKLTRRKVKIFERDGQKVEVKITFMGVEDYGLPIISDMDMFRAFQKLCTDILREQGTLENPVGFTTADIRRIAGKTHGRFAVEVKNWIKRMVLTGIEAEQTVWHAGKKRWLQGVFHVFERAVLMGEELGDNEVADKHYVWLPEWHLNNFNLQVWKYIDYDLHKSLQYPIAKVLYPMLDTMFFASNSRPVSKRYDDLCDELDLTTHRYLADIQRQLDPALEDLKAQKFLSKWKYAKTSDGKAYKITLWAGKRFFDWQEKRKKIVEPSVIDMPELREAQEVKQAQKGTAKIKKPTKQEQPQELTPYQNTLLEWLKTQQVTGAKKVILDSPHKDNPEKIEALKLDYSLKVEQGFEFKVGAKAWLVSQFKNPDYNPPESIEKQKEAMRQREENQRREAAQEAAKEKRKRKRQEYNVFVDQEKARLQDEIGTQKWLKLQAQALENTKKQKFFTQMYQDRPDGPTVKSMIEKEFEKILGIPEFEDWLKKAPEKVA